jgi:putative acetyltransferase
MDIRVDDLQHPAVRALVTEHLRSMHSMSPPESCHALDVDQLRAPEVTLWTAWDGELLLGCGALQQLDPRHGEIKSMRTPPELRRRGAGKALLSHIVTVAKQRGYTRLSLETGSFDAFIPARTLYERFGFRYCGPFGKYREDPLSNFMTLELNPLQGILCR